MPTFDKRSLVSPVPLVVPEATAPVDVSSGDSRKEEKEEEDEATPEGMGETLPLRKANMLRTLPDDDDEADILHRGEPPVIRTRGRPMPAANKRREEAVVLPGANLPAAATSPSVEKGSISAHTSPARSSSRGPGEHPREESAPMAPLAPDAPVSGSAAELHSGVSVRAALSQAAATSEKEKQAVAQAAAAREVALKDVEAAQDHCRVLEAELKTRRNERAEEARSRKAAAQAAAARKAALKDVEAAQDRCRVLEAELKTLHNKCAKEARSSKVEEEKMKAQEDAIKGRDAELEELAKAQAAERSQLEKLE
nr:uncharacterized protein LOC120964670 [Aegilops tauschii subsp. strangulata]